MATAIISVALLKCQKHGPKAQAPSRNAPLRAAFLSPHSIDLGKG